MNRRDFARAGGVLGMGLAAGARVMASDGKFASLEGEYYREAAKKNTC